MNTFYEIIFYNGQKCFNRFRLDFTNSPKKVPNVTLDPADQLKRAEDFILMKHRLKEEALKKKHLSVQRPMGNHFWNQLHQVRGFTLKNEGIASQFNKNNHFKNISMEISLI